ncbi:hypothetical protein IHE44_0009066, partial [Lamprotornis superbus]
MTMCECVQVCAWVCLSLSGYVWVSLSVFECAWLCLSVPECVQVCPVVPHFVRIYFQIKFTGTRATDTPALKTLVTVQISSLQLFLSMGLRSQGLVAQEMHRFCNKDEFLSLVPVVIRTGTTGNILLCSTFCTAVSFERIKKQAPAREKGMHRGKANEYQKAMAKSAQLSFLCSGLNSLAGRDLKHRAKKGKAYTAFSVLSTYKIGAAPHQQALPGLSCSGAPKHLVRMGKVQGSSDMQQRVRRSREARGSRGHESWDGRAAQLEGRCYHLLEGVQILQGKEEHKRQHGNRKHQPAYGPSIPIACHKNMVCPLQQKLELLLIAYSSSFWAFDT